RINDAPPTVCIDQNNRLVDRVSVIDVSRVRESEVEAIHIGGHDLLGTIRPPRNDAAPRRLNRIDPPVGPTPQALRTAGVLPEDDWLAIRTDAVDSVGLRIDEENVAGFVG